MDLVVRLSFERGEMSMLTITIEAATEPVVTIPSAMLVGPNGEMVPDRRFMVFMIDIDVIQNNVATTVLHWFQPDLIMEQAAAQQPVPALPGKSKEFRTLKSNSY